MTTDVLKEHITGFQPNTVFEETGEWLQVFVETADWKAFAQWLSSGPLQMDYLFCVTCIDWSQTATGKTLYTMVYHLTATTHRLPVVVKVKLDRNNPVIATVCDLWRTAEMHEREVYDLFGVQFEGHPDLRRLILTDDFEGYPLRKDFEDPVNMIKL